MRTRQASQTFAVFADVLRLHRWLTLAVLVVVAIDAGLMFGVSPFLIASYAAEIAGGKMDQQIINRITWAVSTVAVAHATLFYLKVRLRRRLTEQGRVALSNMVEEAFQDTSGETHRSCENLTSATQKLQDAWNDLTYQGTELYLQFLFGTLCFFGVVAIQVPNLILPLMGLMGAGGVVAVIAGRRFSVAQQELLKVTTHERNIFEAMNATVSMKWLVDKLVPERQQATRKVAVIFRQQAQTNARWLSILVVMGSLLQIVATAGGPTLQRYGFAPGDVILTVLLCFSMGERFVSMTNMVAIYQHMMAAATPMAEFIQKVMQQKSERIIPDEAGMVCRFEGVFGVYAAGTESCVRVQLPCAELCLGVNVIQGESGAGKSTFVRVLTGDVPYEGSVLIDGYELREWDASGRIVNGTQSLPSINVPLWRLFEEECDLIDWSMASRALRWAAYLDADVFKPLSQVSGGQLRRSMTAAAFYHALRSGIKSGLMVLDEPTNDLDPDCIAKLVEGLQQLSACLPGWIIVVPTHESSLVRIARQLIVFRRDASVEIQTTIKESDV